MDSEHLLKLELIFCWIRDGVLRERGKSRMTSKFGLGNKKMKLPSIELKKSMDRGKIRSLFVEMLLSRHLLDIQVEMSVKPQVHLSRIQERWLEIDVIA